MMDIPKIEIPGLRADGTTQRIVAPAGERAGVLIVDDTPTKLVALAAIVSGMALEIVTATSGEQALRQLLKRDFALILLDVNMPTMDGFETAKLIRSRPRSEYTPIIFVTAEANSEAERFRGYIRGAVDFICSPIIPEILRAKVQVFVDLFCLQRQLLLHTEELKARQQELANSNQALNGLYRIAEGLNRAVSEREVAEAALERALELPGVQAGWIFLREGESGFRLVATRNLPPALEAPGALEGDCLCRRQLLVGELGAVTNVLECERLGKTKVDTRGLHYHASVPLWLGDRMVGVMNLVGPQEGLFKEEELKVLHGVGQQVVVALERARLHEHLESLVAQRTAALTEEIAERKRAEQKVKRLNRIHAVLSGINTTIVRIHDRQELFAEACRIAVEHGQFRMAWIGWLNTPGEDVTLLAKAGFEEGYLDKINLTTKDDEPEAYVLVARALREKTPMVCNDIGTDPQMARWREEALQRGYRSLVVFPLVVGDKVVGLLALYAPEKDFFDAEEMRLLAEIAGDISFALDHIEKEERLNYLAYYDVTTGLPNRALFHDRLNQHLLAASENNSTVALLGVDLEQFRVINDTLGRQAGDVLLKQVAERLRGAGLDANHLAHTGAGCFAVVLDNLQKEADVAHILESRINDSLRRPFVVEGTELRLSAKAGIALFPADGADADSLLRNAAAALEKAKLSGDKYLFYTPEINARVAENLSLENKLRQAVEKEQFVLHYQPKVELEKRAMVGVEALIRWQSPELGLVPPLRFIPLLEETGMILEVGAWALRRAVLDHRHWMEMGLAAPRIAVNVSMIQLRQREFINVLRAAIGEGGSASGIDLEITESLIMDNVQDNITKLQTIRDMGIAIAIDDFGTGYSSLAYLAKLPVQTLKIDRAFIIAMLKDPNAMLLVQTMISLAHSLGLKVVAEGVDEEEQATMLRLLRCDEMQGYLFSKPLPFDALTTLLKKAENETTAPG
jgi:diguanylate cyclase (GGDEF)-like protein